MSRAAARLMLALVILLALAAGAVLVVFLVQNGHWVVVRIPVPTGRWGHPITVRAWETPLAALVGISAAGGALLLLLALLPRWVRAAYRRGRERRRADAMARELAELRALAAGAIGEDRHTGAGGTPPGGGVTGGAAR